MSEWPIEEWPCGGDAYVCAFKPEHLFPDEHGCCTCAHWYREHGKCLGWEGHEWYGFAFPRAAAAGIELEGGR